LQNDRGEISALDFGRRKPLAREIVILAVQPNANAGADAAAAALALIGRGLRNGLDRQALQLGTGRIAADAGRAGIDDVANAGDGERRFGDVRGQDDAAAAVGVKNTVLLGRRKAGIERDDFGLSTAELAAAKYVRGFENVPLCREKDKHIAAAESARLFNGVRHAANGVDIVAVVFAE